MKKEYLYVGASILGWGTIATISKYFLSGLSPYYILSTTSLFAIPVLLVANYKDLGARFKKLNGSTACRMIGVGCFGIVLYNIFLQMGIAVLPAQQAFVINYLWPSFIILFSWPILNEKLTIYKIAAILVAFAGVIIIATNGHIGMLFGNGLYGKVCCLLAAVSYGLYTPLNKKQTYDKDMALILTYAFAAVVAGGISIAEGSFIKPSAFQLVGMVLFGVLANALAYIFWVRAMDIGDTAILSNLVYLTPVVSLIATHFVLGEKITVYSVGGLVLILSGVVIQLAGKGKD